MIKGLKARTLTLGAAAGVMAGMALLVGQLPAAKGEEAPSITVGVYDPQAVFEASEHMEDLISGMTALQGEMQEAQQNGDQQKMMDIQQRAQSEQTRVTDAFEAALDEIFPEIAAEAGVQIIAIEVSYKAPGIEEKDVTDLLLDRLAPEGAEEVVIPAEPF